MASAAGKFLWSCSIGVGHSYYIMGMVLWDHVLLDCESRFKCLL